MSIIEKLYSDAFEDGVNYAIEKMFAEEEKLTDREMALINNKRGRLLGLLGTGGGGNTGYIIGRSQARKKIKEGASDEDVKKAAMKGSLIGSVVPTAGLHALGYIKSKRPGSFVEFKPGSAAFHAIRGAAGSVIGSRMNANEMIERRKTLKDRDKERD